MVSGREIGSTFFNNGGILGLSDPPLDVRSVLILGGRRGPNTSGRSDDVRLPSVNRMVDAVCGFSKS